MIDTAQKVAKQALALPPKSRARLAERLLESLDAEAQSKLDDLWAEESENRIDAYDRGEVRAVSAATVFRRLKSRRRK